MNNSIARFSALFSGTVALSAAVFGSAALAQDPCPTRADLDTGVRLTRSEPYLTSLYRHDGAGLWEMRSEEPGAEGPRSFYPHPLAVGLRDGDGPTLGVAYADDPAVLDRLDEVGTWGTDITLMSDGEPIETGYFTASYLGAEEIEVGGCIYPAWNTRDILILGEGEPIIFEKYYAPGLGLVLRAARIDLNGQGISTVIMDRIELEKD